MNLVYNNKFFSGKRDSLSLFFEYSGDSKLVRFHKVYYIAQELIKLIGPNDNVDQLDMKESIFDISVDEILNSIDEIVIREKIFIEAPDLHKKLISIKNNTHQPLIFSLEFKFIIHD